MEIARSPSPGRSTHRPIQLAIVRANAPFFYSIAAAALLEAAAPVYAERMLHFFAGERELCDWIASDWRARKLARARWLREYIEAAWPEFDWASAHEQYEAARSQSARSPSAAHEALSRCVAAAQTAVFYRSLARWADDLRVREMAREAAHEEADSFARFRAAFDRCAARHRLGFVRGWRAALACVRAARDAHLKLAFEALAVQWGPNAPFSPIDYAEFIRRMAAVIERNGELGVPERVLFGAWKRRPGERPTGVQRARTPRFKPVLTQTS